jgi:FkbM family methyltransferase
MKYLIRKIINKLYTVYLKGKKVLPRWLLIKILKQDKLEDERIILDKIRDQSIRLWYFFDSDIGRSLYLTGSFENETLSLIKKIIKPGDVIFDIGANIGQYSVFMSKCLADSGIIYAIEPYKKNIQLIEKNIATNKVSNVSVHQIAIAEVSGPTILRVYSDYAYNSLLLIDRKKLLREEMVEGQTLDDFVEKNRITRIDLIKIDIEGFELSAFKGAVKTLKKLKPAIITEIQPLNMKALGIGRQDILDYLSALGYNAFLITDRGLRQATEPLSGQFENYYFTQN